jgi:cysteinyl-tRNA synthetase
MYVCGMTVYDFCHIGHARVMIVFDMVARWLRASGYEVIYVRNITDIDDKIIQRAIQNGESIATLTQRFIDAMHADSDALGLNRPDQEPRATAYIEQMQGMIGRLMEQEIAYLADDGDVNYAVRLFPGYGRLSGKSLDDLNAGERVAVGSGKRDPLDFVLWKSAKEDEPSDTRWQSPWGEGRPGWHIECSAMSCALLGQHFDIHGGGADLQFPHHENEIAQTEGALYGQERSESDAPWVNYWMHNGHIRVNQEKMSKSLGNFFLIRDVLKRYDPEVIRFFMLRAHYRSPINYSDAQLDESRSGLVRLYTALAQANTITVPASQNAAPTAPWTQRFNAAMDDDFNTPEAIAVLFDLATELNRKHAAGELDSVHALAECLRSLAGVLGFLERDPATFLQNGSPGELDASAIEQQIAARVAAKQAKAFEQADQIRADLLKQGVVLEDKLGGITEWRRA